MAKQSTEGEREKRRVSMGWRRAFQTEKKRREAPIGNEESS